MKKFLIPILLLSLLYSQSSKPVIGVGEILYGGDAVESWRTELEARLVSTNKFDIIERQRLNDILREQGLGASGLVEGSGKIGGIGGIDYIVYGTITSITQEIVAESYWEVNASLSVKVVDLSTGKIVLNQNLKTDSFDDNKKKAIAEVRADLSRNIAKRIAFKVFPIKIAQIDGKDVYINYGKGAINSSGAYKAFKMTGGFRDPDTGELLGSKENYMGLIDIRKREEKYSIGKIIHSVGTIQIGDQLKWVSEKNFKKLKKKYNIK